MNPCFEQMERCAQLARAQDAAALDELLALTTHAAWEVRLAATVALGDRADARAVAPLLALLRAEDAAPLFTQDKDYGGIPAGSPFADGTALVFPAGTTVATLAAWERRGRLKQAACLALGQIGPAALEALPFLHRYVTDMKEDYAVRAAAAKALGMLRDPASRPFLETATTGEEWCAKTEAVKALQALPGGT